MKATLNEIRDELIDNYNNGTLYEYLSEHILEIRKENNGVEKLVFGIGGPSIWLEVTGDYTGCVCGSWASKEDRSVISFLLWLEMKKEIIELLEEIN